MQGIIFKRKYRPFGEKPYIYKSIKKKNNEHR